jgi:hypothetical protein
LEILGSPKPRRLRTSATPLKASTPRAMSSTTSRIRRAKVDEAIAEELEMLAEEARDVEGRVLAVARRVEDIALDDDASELKDSALDRLKRAIAVLRGRK